MRGLYFLVILFSLSHYPILVDAQPIRVFTIGNERRPWEEGGGGIDPEILFFGKVDTTNTPEDAIGFVKKPGWVGPRYFELEENVASRVLLEGGNIRSPNSLQMSSSVLKMQLEGTVNGDHSVAFERKPTLMHPDANARGIWVILDFGRRIGIHRVRFYPRNTVVESPSTPNQNDYLRGYELWINDRQTNTAQNAPDQLVARNEKNERPIVDIDVEPQYVRLVKVRSLSVTPFEFDEIEIYGTGYLSDAIYISDVLDLNGPANIGTVRWVEDVIGQQEFSALSVKARTGVDDTPILYQRKGIGEFGDSFLVEVSGRDYHELDRLSKGPIVHDEENWSQWKSIEQGVQLNAPNPRQYIQFRIDFRGRIFDSRHVDYLQFDYLQPPIADTLRAEVYPRLAKAEERATFHYAVLLRAIDVVRGYDRLKVDTNIRVEQIRNVRINGNLVDFTVIENETTHFTIGLPLISGDKDLLEFSFDLPIFRFGSTFSGRAFNSKWPLVPQILESGNAVSFGPSDNDDLASLAVAIPEAQVGKLVGKILFSTSVITPNGDGVNDQVDIFFNLLQLTRPTQVVLEIYDLAGNKVHIVTEAQQTIGPVTYQWDGFSAEESLLMPGSYIWLLRVKADAFEEIHKGVIAIAY